MKKQTGIYICSGCEIGNCIDINGLKDKVVSTHAPKVCKTHAALCSIEGYDLIAKDIAEEQLDSVIIAACSYRNKTEIFQFDDQVELERTNLREQLAWVSDPLTEDTQMLAEDYLAMSIAKIETITKPIPYLNENISSDVLVVGAGITGITAALETAKAGYRVHIIEKEVEIGGWSRKWQKQIPYQPPYTNLVNPVLPEKAKELAENTNIKVYTSTQIKELSGEPGNFEVTLLNGSEQKLHVGSVVLSMGWKPYDANLLSHLAYGKSKQVLTNIEFENYLSNDKNKIPQIVTFIQCAGSRDKNHLAYCSSYCCATTLKQARLIREKSKNTLIYIIYKDIRTLGLYEEFYKECQKDDGIFFTKGEVSSVENSDNKVRILVEDNLLGETISIQTDLLVLATGMTPADTTELNLTYRQGKGLPELKYNFTDSHFICFPYETRRTGIYTAGCLRTPMDIAASMQDATGAAMKAIQCIEATKRGEAVHPRSGDVSYPDLFLDRCTDCKRCTEECPFGAYDETEKGTPLINPARCRRCGICLGACPERVINFADYSINSVSAMIKAIHIPDEFEEKPRILAFVCENDAYPALDTAGVNRLKYSSFVRVIPVRCIGSVNKVWISDALSAGFDGILQIGCKPGDDYQCHFIQGSELTEKRGENLQETLETMMLETERIQTKFVEITDYEKITQIINDFVEEIEEIGPNPFKDM